MNGKQQSWISLAKHLAFLPVDLKTLLHQEQSLSIFLFLTRCTREDLLLRYREHACFSSVIVGYCGAKPCLMRRSTVDKLGWLTLDFAGISRGLCCVYTIKISL